jgi:hypothetical protein
LGGVESVKEGMAEDFQAFLQCCTELHEWEAAQEGCALISMAVTEGIALDAVESNLTLAATNRDSYVDKEVDFHRRGSIQRAIQASGQGYAPETLFWGYEEDWKEMELLRQTQLIALSDRDLRRDAQVVGEDWTGNARQMATTVDLEQRLSVARHIQLFDHEEWGPSDDADLSVGGSVCYDTMLLAATSTVKGRESTTSDSRTTRQVHPSTVHWQEPSCGSRESRRGVGCSMEGALLVDVDEHAQTGSQGCKRNRRRGLKRTREHNCRFRMV